MIEFVPFKPDHLDGIVLQAAQAEQGLRLSFPEWRQVFQVPRLSYSLRLDGRVAGSAGILPQWKTTNGGCASAWALLGEIPPPVWPAVARRCAAMIARAHRMGYARIEAGVDYDFAAGHRFVEWLGFVCEGPACGRSVRGVPEIRYAHLSGGALAQYRAIEPGAGGAEQERAAA